MVEDLVQSSCDFICEKLDGVVEDDEIQEVIQRHLKIKYNISISDKALLKRIEEWKKKNKG